MKATAPRTTRSRRPLVLDSAIDIMAVFTIATLVMMVAVTGPPAQAQTFAVLHAFTGSGDGGSPNGISAVGPEGNLYGTAASGGVTNDKCPQGCGNIFELKHSGGNWLVDPLYSFRGGNLGDPVFGITRAANGAIYGQNRGPGGVDVPGLVYELTSVAGHWTLTVLYQFNPNGNDAYESTGEVILDAKGNIYGTSTAGGPMGAGTVYELTFTGGQWVEKDLWYFGSRNGTEGWGPHAGVVMDQQGNLYGTTTMGSTHGCGAVFRLTPTQSGFWNGHTLYSFPALGAECSTATGGVILDAAGNVYGEVANSSPSSGVFELSPSGGGWTYTLLYGATWGGNPNEPPRLVMDSAGNLYGTTPGGTYCNPQCDDGTVFKLTRSNGRWRHSLLYEFHYDLLNGGIYPGGDLSVDSSGNLYGTTSLGGDTSCNPPNGCGLAYKITP